MKPGPFTFARAVRFDEVDAAGFVYFAKVAALAHEAMERLLEEKIEGGYARWIGGVEGPRIGLPCVHLACEFRSAFRFGDTFLVTLAVRAVGTSSVRFDVTIARGEGGICATIEYVVACAELDGPRKHPLPREMRAVFEGMLDEPPDGTPEP